MNNSLSIHIKDLVKSYHTLDQKFLVLDHLQMEVQEGSIVSVEGSSGVGKSTLLNILGGMDDFDSGEVWVMGEPLHKFREKEKESFRAKTISMIFQQHLLLPDFTALENVMMALMIEGIPSPKAKKMSTEMLEKVGLKDRLSSFPAQLSGGESARVGVARALVNEKKLILADEPTGNLDKENAKNLWKLITDLQKAMNFSLILVTHDPELASQAHSRNQLQYGKLTPK
jgi:lipoprotein-releasing system ATP-binding protein